MQPTLKGSPLSQILPGFISSLRVGSKELYGRQDANHILAVLPHIHLRQGYSLGVYYVGEMLGGITKFYPFRTGSTDEYDPGEPNRDIEEKSMFDIDRYHDMAQKGDEEAKKILELIHHPIPFRDGQVVRCSLLIGADESIPKLQDYLDIDFTPESVWESLLLLELSSNYLPHGWHGCYANGDIVVDYKTLREACGSCYGIGKVDWKQFKNDDRLLPSVTMESESGATVKVCRWNDWRGLDLLTFHALREGRSIRFEREDPINLIQYNCGICF